MSVKFLHSNSWIGLLLVITVFYSCRKDIDVKLPEYKQKLVIEASIEPGEYAQVLLSESAAYFGDKDLSDPTQFFVKGAFATISDGNLIDTLKELIPGTGYFYSGVKIKGVVGGNYTLKVVYKNKIYTAYTNILNPVKLDKLFFKGEKDSLGFCWATLSEPGGLGNAYRWFAKRISKDQFFAAPFSSAFDDKFVDGKTFDFAYERPPQPNQTQTNDDDENRGYYKLGDTVVVKFCTIGYNEYLFWRSYYTNKSSNGNPFSAPANLQNTIIGGDAIGAFTGYSPSFDTIVISK